MFKLFTTVAASIMVLSVSLASADEIKLSGGSTSITVVIEPVKAAFEKATGHRVLPIASGSKAALQKLDSGEIEVATAAHTTEELLGVIEKDKIQLKNKDKLNVVQLASPTPYSVIVNQANPVTTLSKDQLNGIFSGKITNWKDLGGNDLPILCVISNLSPGSNDLFSKTYMDGKKITVETLEASTAADVRQNVSSSPEAIGFIAASLVDASVKKVETPAMNSKPIILLTLGPPSPKVQKLIDFIKTEGPKYIK